MWCPGCLSEARGIGSGLGAELSEIEIRAGFVSDIHRLPELAFRVEAVEDDGIDGDGDSLDDDLNEAADQ